MNRTKESISAAFWQLLEEKPYNRITVQNIVDRCQINRNTFYYHFQDIPALAEYSIKEWTEQVIRKNYEFGAPITCITPIMQEFIKRKTAFIHIYCSSHKDAFIRYLNEISQHIVQSYIDCATKDINIPLQDKLAFIKYYKCTFAGVVLDWLDTGASYDIFDFCERICDFLEGSGKNAFLKCVEK